MPSRSWARRAVPLLVAIAPLLAGCGGDATAPSEGATLTVYVSLPLSGPSAADGRDAAEGAGLALADAGSEIGGYAIEAEFLDGSDGERGWTPAQAAANARLATQDSTAIAYVGEFEAGASRVSVPLTNGARMLQVSPASAAVDLVAPFEGSDDVPEVQPSGERTFGRVIPSDVVQAEAGAAWARELGWGRVGVRDDGSDFGRGLADAFEGKASVEGVELDSRAPAFTYLAGGPALLATIPGEPLTTGGEPARMGSDALLEAADDRPDEPPPTYVTSAALDPSQLPPAGRDFAAAFEAEYDRAPGRYAAYGYEAMAVVLDSVARASDPADRAAVVAAFFETTGRESVLGEYAIGETGETTLDRLAGYELRDGDLEPVAELRAP